MSHSVTSATSNSQKKGYPLTALFLVLTACCIVAAMLGPALQGVFDGKIGRIELVWAIFLGVGSATIIGGCVGLSHYHRARGLGWGLLVGSVLGTFVGPLVLVPVDRLGTMFGISAGGALVVVLVAIGFRFASRAK